MTNTIFYYIMNPTLLLLLLLCCHSHLLHLRHSHRMKITPDQLLKPGEIIAGKYMLVELFNYETNLPFQLRWVASDIATNYLFILKFYFKSLSKPGGNPKVQEYQLYKNTDIFAT